MRDCESASQPHTGVRTKPPPALQAPTGGFNPLRADIRILQPPATRCTSSALLVTARILAYCVLHNSTRPSVDVDQCPMCCTLLRGRQSYRIDGLMRRWPVRLVICLHT